LSGYRTLKSIHLASTAWFILCIIYLLVLTLRQAGVHWWIIFSLSGYSIFIIFLLISLYIFAILRGVSSAQAIEPEHPLTHTNYYKGFYVTAPFLGGLAGCIGMIGVDRIVQFAAGIALGTFGTTFLVWVILDPVTGLLETLLLPASRKHRTERIAQAKVKREKKQKDRERLLTEILAKEESERRRRQQVLRPQAEKLAELLAANGDDFEQVEREAVDIGLKAWQMGGLNCMQQLRDMAIDISREREQNKEIVDYISFWWDGIGTWRASPLNKGHWLPDKSMVRS
jgi:hypothetical protein